MVGKAHKFAVSLSLSVSKEMHDRFRTLQRELDELSIKKTDKPFRQADLGTIVVDIGLGVLEALPKPTKLDLIATREIDERLIKVEVKKTKHRMKQALSIGSMTDEEIQAVMNGEK